MLNKYCQLSTTSIAIAFSLLLALDASAVPQLTLSSSGAPVVIAIGQSMTINVELAGLNSNEALDSLGATIRFDDSLFGPPSISLGEIVPDALVDPSDVLMIEDAGIADVSFLTFGTLPDAHIRSNGLFFSIGASALRTGNAAFSFEFVDATAFNPGDPSNPIPLPISSSADLLVAVIPEPMGGTLMLMGVSAPLFWRNRNGLRNSVLCISL